MWTDLVGYINTKSHLYFSILYTTHLNITLYTYKKRYIDCSSTSCHTGANSCNWLSHIPTLKCAIHCGRFSICSGLLYEVLTDVTRFTIRFSCLLCAHLWVTFLVLWSDIHDDGAPAECLLFRANIFYYTWPLRCFLCMCVLYFFFTCVFNLLWFTYLCASAHKIQIVNKKHLLQIVCEFYMLKITWGDNSDNDRVRIEFIHKKKKSFYYFFCFTIK